MKKYSVMDMDLIEVNETKYSAQMPNEDSPLYRSIADTGIKVPVVVDFKGRLLDGLKRYKIYQKLGQEKIPTIICDNIKELAELTEQLRQLSLESTGLEQDWNPRRIYQLHLDATNLKIRAASVSRSKALNVNPDYGRYRYYFNKAVGIQPWRVNCILSMYRAADDPENPMAKRMAELIRDVEAGVYSYSHAWKLYMNERERRDFFFGDVVGLDDQVQLLEEASSTMAGVLRGLTALGKPNKKLTASPRYKTAMKKLTEERTKLYRFMRLLKEKTSVE